MSGGTTGATRSKADPLGDRLRGRAQSLSPAARRVLELIDRNRATALASSAADLAAMAGTSDATVVRAVQALGFSGLPDLKQVLAATLDARPTPADAMRETLAEVGPSAERAVDLVLETHKEAMRALEAPAVRERISAAVGALHAAARILVFGIGPSAQLARYTALLLGRSGRQARALDATGIAMADQLLDLRAGDALLVLAFGRSYREVVATFGEASRQGLQIVLVTDSLEERLRRQAKVVIPVQRGRAERIALHGATLVLLEALVLALAASAREGALATLERLNELRAAVSGGRRDLG